MKNLFFVTVFVSGAFVLSTFSSSPSRADDSKLEQEADQATAAAKQSEDLAKAGREEVQAAKDRAQDLSKKINEAELSKFKTDGDIQKLHIEFQQLVKDNEAAEKKLNDAMAALEKRKGEADVERQKNSEENNRLKKEIQELKDKLSAEEDANRTAESQAKEAKNENEKARDEKQSLMAKTEKANHTKMRLDEEIKTYGKSKTRKLSFRQP